MLNTKRSNLKKARKFANKFRFIDYLCAIKDEFEKNFQKKLPSRYIINRENTSTLEASFLDLEINVKHRELETELHDKRDVFPFSNIRMSYQDNNMPTRVFYTAVGSEILHFQRTGSSKEKE